MTSTTELPMKALSPSKIDLAGRCPAQFKHRYVLKLPEVSSGVMHGGIVFHDVMEFAQREQLLDKPIPSHKDLDDRFMETWEAKKKETEQPKPPTSLQTGEEVSIVEVPGSKPSDRRYDVYEGMRTIGSFARQSDAEAALTQRTGE